MGQEYLKADHGSEQQKVAWGLYARNGKRGYYHKTWGEDGGVLEKNRKAGEQPGDAL